MRLARPLVCAVAVLLVGSGTEAVADPATAPDAPAVVLVATVAPGTSVAGVADKADEGSADVRHVLTPLRRVSVDVPADDAAAEARRLDALPGVTSVTRAARRYVSAVPDDTYYAQYQQSYLNAVNAPAAWDITHGSSVVKIGLVDTGVDVTHPDLANKIAGTFDAETGSSDVPDDVGHGTFTSGVAAADTDNAVGVAGAGYDAQLLMAKVDRQSLTGDGYVITSDDEAAGIRWVVDHGARIVNISLGAEGTDPTEFAAIRYAQAKGALIVAAAGNENSTTPSYPASYPGVISVGATDVGTGGRASFSNYGPTVDLAAPGVDIYSTTPGGGLLSSPGYNAEDGTSFSSPLVAGAAALLLGYYPSASAAQLQRALVGTAHGYAGQGLGTGQVDFAAALRSLALTDVAGAGSTFYPTRDGYRDTFAPSVVLGRPATLSLVIRSAARSVVRTVSAARGAGRTSLTWSGTNSSGRRVAAGRYTFQFTSVDSSGLRSSTPVYGVTLSSKRLVTVSHTVTRRGSQVSSSVRDATCERVTKSRLGRRLVNSCVPGRKRTVQAAYRFTLPSAVSYSSLTASVRGRSASQPARITGRVTKSGGGSSATGSRTVRSATVTTYSLGRVSARQHVTGRTARLLIGVTNRYTTRGNPSDLDISRVSLRVVYRVLR